MRISEEEAASRIKAKSGGQLTYVSGYQTKESAIVVRCNICGETFSRTYHHLTTHTPTICPSCALKEREEIRLKQREEVEKRRKERRLIALAREAEKRKRKPHPCLVCGCETIRPKYCSDACSKKAMYAVKDHRRRVKISSAMVDKDITVKGLYKRDKGICYLCGEKCDFEDYTVKNGFFIAGNRYPSIDHIVPLAKGGKHSWDNVRLAHRICNSIKRDKLENYEQNESETSEREPSEETPR